jgi:glutaminyl-tRNA synthetase
MTDEKQAPADRTAANFIEELINEDLAQGKNTRFPPEPNGYLHIGHAKSICLNFGIAASAAAPATCVSTTPTRRRRTSSTSMPSGRRALARLHVGRRALYASDYFEKLYECAELIREGKAYVDDLTADEIREYRGTLTEPGKDSPYRDRSVDENLDLFRACAPASSRRRARAAREDRHGVAEHQHARPGALPDPQASHHRTGDAWCIYPMYDYAHPISTRSSGITHSLCTLEFEDHRPLYDWCIENLPLPATSRGRSSSRA